MGEAEMKPRVFISYAHEDKKLATRLVEYLSIYKEDRLLEFWIDDRLLPGAKLKKRIGWEIEHATTAVLLISDAFLESNFIRDIELPRIINRAELELLRVIPVILKYCYSKKHKPILDDLFDKYKFWECDPSTPHSVDPSTPAHDPWDDDQDDLDDKIHKLALASAPNEEELRNRLEQLAAYLAEAELPSEAVECSSRNYDQALQEKQRDDSKKPKDEVSGFVETLKRNDYASLGISLHHLDRHTYRVEFRFSISYDDVDDKIMQWEIKLDPDSLPTINLETSNDIIYEQGIQDYGDALTNALFTTDDLNPDDLKELFSNTVVHVRKEKIPLRFRILIGPSAYELNSIHWELLKDPITGDFIAQHPGTWLSTFLMPRDSNWAPAHLRSKAKSPKGIVMAIAPGHISPPTINSTREAQEAGDCLAKICGKRVDTLPGNAGAPTYMRLIDSFNRADILHFICHAEELVDGQIQWVSLDSTGAARLENVDELTNLWRQKTGPPPRLVILQPPVTPAGGDDVASPLFRLAPKFAATGICSVLAFQTSISREALKTFFEEFYRVLKESGGFICTAVSAGRQAIIENGLRGWWSPSLFVRLKTPRIWYRSGFRTSVPRDTWAELISAVMAKKMVPVIGPGLFRPIIGSREDIAEQLSIEHHFPMGFQERVRLRQVARFMIANKGEPLLHNRYESTLRKLLIKKYGEGLRVGAGSLGIDELISTIGAFVFERDPMNALKILADLKLDYYVTTSMTRLLEDALKIRMDKEGKKKGVTKKVNSLVHPWRKSMEGDLQDKALFEEDVNENMPLVYHLFGRHTPAFHQMLSEDDFLKLLRAVERNGLKAFPGILRRRLATHNLLLLGFRLNEWDFKIVLQILQYLSGETEGNAQRRLQVSVQLDPDDDFIMEPNKAKEYLEKYFNLQNITVFWGGEDDFLRELHTRVQKARTA